MGEIMKSTNRNRVVEIYTRKFDGLHRMVGVTLLMLGVSRMIFCLMWEGEFATEGWTIFLNYILWREILHNYSYCTIRVGGGYLLGWCSYCTVHPDVLIIAGFWTFFKSHIASPLSVMLRRSNCYFLSNNVEYRKVIIDVLLLSTCLLIVLNLVGDPIYSFRNYVRLPFGNLLALWRLMWTVIVTVNSKTLKTQPRMNY